MKQRNNGLMTLELILKKRLTSNQKNNSIYQMKQYKTYQAKNAVKAAQVTNHIIAGKKAGVAHAEAKAEAYRLFQIKAGQQIILKELIKNLS